MNSHQFLAANAPAPIATPAPSVATARTALEKAGRDLAAIPDVSMERTWRWRDRDADVRYGLFRVLESVEGATAEVAAILGATEARPGAAALRIAPSTVARWSLHGRLMGLDDGWLDRVGKEGEWTIRETLAHIVGGQRGYVTYNAWYLTRSSDERPTDAERAALDAEAGLPEEVEEGTGTLAEIRARLDDTYDEGAAYLGAISDADLRHRAWWSGIPVDLEFRLGRLSSHTVEHTIQVDKTLAMLGREPTEVERLVRLILATYGRLEAELVGRPVHELDRPLAGGRSAAAILTEVVDEAVATASDVTAAASR